MQPAVLDSASPAAKEQSLYRALDFVLIRAPLLPVEAYTRLMDERGALSLLADPHVRRAVTVGSPSLAGAIERFHGSGLTPRDADRMRAKLLRYQIRMSTRPTPFGLFAGVALGEWGETTDLQIRSTCARTRTRPDMALVMGLVSSAEADITIRRRLGMQANPLAFFEAGRVNLPDRAPGSGAAQGSPVSIRATNVVKRALALARTPVPYDVLVAELCKETPSATPEKVDKLLADLWAQTFLLTDLRPPLTTSEPARYVVERLAGIPEAGEVASKLERLLTAASAWDELDPEESIVAFANLVAQAAPGKDASREPAVQVDMAMRVDGRVAGLVAQEAVRAAELLLRLTPYPRGLSSLASYRQAFIGRYGHEREVPLMELMNPNRGLGPPSQHGHAHVGPDPEKAAQRDRMLLRLACAALRDRSRVVELGKDDIVRLQTWNGDVATAPVSLDLNILVGAASAAALDRGEFTLSIGPNLGGMAAGRNLGRFADLLGGDGRAALAQIDAMEAAHAPEQLRAEMVFLPSHLRSANVVVRPAIRDYEIVFGVSAGVPPSRVIPLEELVVGIDHGRFYVRWPAVGKRVVFSSGHMLNLYSAPPVARFLVDIALDAKTVFSSFEWGPASDFPRLPRVQSGRIALSPAQWQVRKEELAFDSAASFERSLQRWRAEWDVPRHVCLSFGDNRLVIDLDAPAQAAELKAELEKLTEGRALLLQEMLPALEEAWLQGPGGHYYSEFVVSLVLRQDVTRAAEASPASARPPAPEGPVALERAASPERASALAPTGEPTRLHPPGSEWLFVKLYGPRNLEDDLIADSVLPFAENVVAAGLADSWFFIRYSDPDSHLRLRFHGPPERLSSLLFKHTCEWASGLMAEGMCARFVFDAYEQEVERFGGPAGVAVAESVFFADSRCTAKLLRDLKGKAWPHDRTTMLALSVDDLLGGLGLDESQRLAWYRSQTDDGGPEGGSDYRKRKPVLRSLLGRWPYEAEDARSAGIAAALAARRDDMKTAQHRLAELTSEGVLGHPISRLASTYIHLHVNRLGGLDSAPEQRILSLLLRTRDGLQKAPIGRQALSGGE